MDRADKLLTPKELADAIGASESSLRRWVDNGLIRMSRTAGGHRRIPLVEAIQFIRSSGATIVRPELLGFPETPAGNTASTEEQLFDLLLADDRSMAQSLIRGWYLQGRRLAAIFDGPVRNTMYRMGELWHHDPRGVLVEHRATDASIETIALLRSLMPAADTEAPLAIGGAPEGDPYLLPSLMVGAVLAEVGYRDVNFGANTPLQLIGQEALQRNARVVWVSVSASSDPKALRSELQTLAQSLAERSINLVVGGRFQPECAPRGMGNVVTATSMTELAAYARGLLHAIPGR